jgi:hypothetical protein
MHYVHEPETWYWRRFVWDVEQSGTTRLEMVKERDVTDVFGKPIEHFAHKADVLRLEALRDYGGVYLDVDVLVVKGALLSFSLYHCPLPSEPVCLRAPFLKSKFTLLCSRRLHTSLSP